MKHLNPNCINFTFLLSSFFFSGYPYIEVISTINGASSSSLFHDDFLLPLLVPVPSTPSEDCFDEWVNRLILTTIFPAVRIETWGCSGRGLSVLSVFLWPSRTLITRPLGILKLIGRPIGTSPNDLRLAALIGIGGAGKSSSSEKISWWPRWLIYIVSNQTKINSKKQRNKKRNGFKNMFVSR